METKISTSDLNLYYGNNHALKNINLDIYENQITAFIGPSGCGKSTYLNAPSLSELVLSELVQAYYSLLFQV